MAPGTPLGIGVAPAIGIGALADSGVAAIAGIVGAGVVPGVREEGGASKGAESIEDSFRWL